MPTPPSPPSIEANNLSYAFPGYAAGLHGISFALPARSRTLLIGSNGAGKTTLLRLLAGKRLAPRGAISVCGLDPFADGLQGVTYLGLEWVLNPVVRADVGVDELLRSVGGDAFPDRRDRLVRVLDIDPAWRLHAVSDGERRRVQLAMGLVRPWAVLLLDEVTVDLDVLSRAGFLAWLRRETETRDCTVLYATHVLDDHGLADWPTHLVHMHMGCVKEWGPAHRFLRRPTPSDHHHHHRQQEEEKEEEENGGHEAGSRIIRLGELAIRWLTEDLADRGPRSQAGIGPEGRTYGFGGSDVRSG